MVHLFQWLSLSYSLLCPDVSIWYWCPVQCACRRPAVIRRVYDMFCFLSDWCDRMSSAATKVPCDSSACRQMPRSQRFSHRRLLLLQLLPSTANLTQTDYYQTTNIAGRYQDEPVKAIAHHSYLWLLALNALRILLHILFRCLCYNALFLHSAPFLRDSYCIF